MSFGTKRTYTTEECSICLDLLSKATAGISGVITLQCQHEFHCSCLKRWELNTSGPGRSALCPECREPFKCWAAPAPAPAPGVVWSVAHRLAGATQPPALRLSPDEPRVVLRISRPPAYFQERSRSSGALWQPLNFRVVLESTPAVDIECSIKSMVSGAVAPTFTSTTFTTRARDDSVTCLYRPGFGVTVMARGDAQATVHAHRYAFELYKAASGVPSAGRCVFPPVSSWVRSP